MVVAHQKLLEGQYERCATNIGRLGKQVEQAVKGGEATKQAALVLIQEWEREKSHLEEIKGDLARAQEASKKIMEMRAAFEQKIRRQMEECRAQDARFEMAKAEEQMASVMGNFKVADASDTLDEITGKIDEKLARARGQLEVASQSTESQSAQVELQTAAASSEGTYAELQAKFGIATSTPVAETTKTMDSIPVSAECVKWVEPQTAGQ
jgi:phage shock protein A